MIRDDLKTSVQIFFWLSFLLLIVASTSALALQAPGTVVAGESAQITWNDSAPLLRDGNQVASTSPFTWQTTQADIGSYTFSSQNETANLEVVSPTIAISIDEPQDTSTNNAISIVATVTGVVDFCYYTLDGNTNTLTQTANTYSGQAILDDGIYTLTVSCKRNSQVESKQKTVLIDTTAPKILETYPQGRISQESAELRVVTDEIASCTANNETLVTSDKLTHTKTITKAGLNEYSIQCTDAHGNTGPTESISFVLAKQASARIEVDSDKEVLTAGSYPVTVHTSQELEDVTLRFNYQGGGSQEVAVSKEQAQEWTGYLSIRADAGERVGSFTAELQTYEGETSTSITKGEIYLVDTKAPDPVTQAKAELIDDGDRRFVRLSWSDNQEVTYNIYRSERDRVSINDYYASTEENYFEDKDAGKQYYYVVAPEDEAGNVGEPSRILTATVPLRSQEQLPNENLAKAILDLETAKKDLDNEQDAAKLTVIKNTPIYQDVDELLSRLKSFNATADSEAVQQAVAQVNSKLPVRIQIDGQVGYEELRDARAQNEVLANVELLLGLAQAPNSADLSRYQSELERLNEEATIETSIVAATVYFADRSTQGYTFVERQIKKPKSAGQVTIVEMPEAEIVQTSLREEAGFYTKQISAQEEQQSYSYRIDKSLAVPQAREAKAVLMPEFEASTNAITGEVVSDTQFALPNSYWLGALVIAGLVIYYVAMPAGPTNTDQTLKSLTQILQQQVPRTTRTPMQPRQNFGQYYRRRTPQFFERRKLEQKPQSYYPKSLSINDCLQEAHALIDQKEYIPAKKHYERIVNKDLQGEQAARAKELYYKIMLYQAVQSGLRYADEGAGQELKQHLNLIQDVATKVPESETALITDAKKIYKELHSVANKLAIEQDKL